MQPLLTTENKLVELIVEPRYRWLRHLLLQVLVLIISYSTVISTFLGRLQFLGSVIPYIIFFQFLIYLGMIYPNIYVLVPRMLFRGRYISYGFWFFVLLTAGFVASYYLEYWVIAQYSIEPTKIFTYVDPSRSIFIDYVSIFFVTGMCSVGATITLLFRNWLTDGKRKQDMETQHRQKRILQLKDSVSPAFLSQVLSTAARTTSADAVLSGDILTRLSRFLRYRLYDSSREKVTLNSEAAFIDNYLSLVANIRQGFTYSVSSPGSTARTVLPPSVLINVIDIILQNVQVGILLDAALGFETDGQKETTLNFTFLSPGFLPAGKIEETLDDLLDLSLPSGYTLAVRSGGGKLNIRIGLHQTPALL